MEQDITDLFEHTKYCVLRSMDGSIAVGVHFFEGNQPQYVVDFLANHGYGETTLLPLHMWFYGCIAQPGRNQVTLCKSQLAAFLARFLYARKCMTCKQGICEGRLGVCGTCFMRLPACAKERDTCSLCMESSYKFQMISPSCCNHRNHFHRNCLASLQQV